MRRSVVRLTLKRMENIWAEGAGGLDSQLSQGFAALFPPSG